MNQERDISFFCRDTTDIDVTSEQQHFSQAKRFLITAREDQRNMSEHQPEGSDYVLLALIGKDMLARSNKSKLATVMTVITLAFRSLQPIEIDEVGTAYRTFINWSI